MLTQTLRSFLKIGIVGFGGGSALIPVVEAEVVSSHHYITKEQYAEHNIVGNITPGALPPKLGMLSGYDMAGLPGMAAGAFAVSFPGALLTVLFLSLLSVLGTPAVQQIRAASIGISAFIIVLLLEYVAKVLRDAAQGGRRRSSWVLMIGSFLLTCGKEALGLLEDAMGGTLTTAGPLFDISTIDLLVLVFFLIFFTGGKIKSKRMAFACVLSVLYVLLYGKGALLGVRGGLPLQAGLLLLAVLTMLRDMRREGIRATGQLSMRTVWKKVGVFLIPLVIVFVFAFALCRTAPTYLVNGLLSTVTSFGGGEAYLTVAEGIFVSSGMVDSSAFYGQIVPIANALPGPILVKILCGIGYLIGLEDGGMWSGYAMALLGLMIGVCGTCIVCILVEAVYRKFSSLPVFATLKAWILPVICGMLLTTVLSMVGESVTVIRETGSSFPTAFFLVAGLYLAANVLQRKLPGKDLLVILVTGAASVAIFHLL